MPLAHREITKKHIKRIAEKAAENAGGGLPIDDDSATLVYPIVSVDKDYKTKGLYSCGFTAYLNDSALKNYWNEHLNVGEGVETFSLDFSGISDSFVFINYSLYVPLVRYYKNSSGITEKLTINATTSSDSFIDRIVANDWSWSPDVLMNIAFVEYNILSASVNVNPPHEEYVRVKKIEGRPKNGFFYYDESNNVFTEYTP